MTLTEAPLPAAASKVRYETSALADIPDLTRLFLPAFPEALFAVFDRDRLPPSAVNDFFSGLYQCEPSGFIVARSEERIIGYMIVCSDRSRLRAHLLWNGTLLRMIVRWLSGRYPGLEGRFALRLARLCWEYWKSENNANAPAQVLSIVVDPAYRRRGVGRQMTERGLAYLRRTSATAVRLEVDAAKEAPIRLYERYGFKEIARLPTPRGSALIMSLPLRS